jgi:hypothetical protein
MDSVVYDLIKLLKFVRSLQPGISIMFRSLLAGDVIPWVFKKPRLQF